MVLPDKIYNNEQDFYNDSLNQIEKQKIVYPEGEISDLYEKEEDGDEEDLEEWEAYVKKKEKNYENITGKKQVEIPRKGKLISEFCEEVSKILAEKKTIFYRPEIKEIVEINAIQNKGGDIQDSGFVMLKPNRFITLLEQYIRPVIPGKYYGKQEKSIDAALASIVLESPQMQNNLPKIRRIFNIPLPIIHEGKLIIPEKGYDQRFDSWRPLDSPDIIHPEMSLDKAKEILLNIYGEFCFKTNQDYVNAIANLLTPFLRGLFKKFSSRTPLFFYMGNRERAGKDYCAGITGILYENYAIEEPPICSTETSKNQSNAEELRKKILSAFINGRKRLHFANNKGHIDNSVLEAVLTSETYSDRILGKNENLIFNNELDFSASGNVGINFTPDLANRMRTIRLFLEIEDANSRSFSNPHLHQYVKENRGLILSALYSLVRNWFENGMPKGKVPFTSFPDWAEICGGIMECAGYSSPCNPDKETSTMTGDIESSDMKTLFELCYRSHPEQWINREIIRDLIIEEGNIFSYLNLNEKADKIKFANKLTRFYRRILSEIQLIVKNPQERASRHEFKFTKNKELSNKEVVFDIKTLVLDEIIKDLSGLGGLNGLNYSTNLDNTLVFNKPRENTDHLDQNKYLILDLEVKNDNSSSFKN